MENRTKGAQPSLVTALIFLRLTMTSSSTTHIHNIHWNTSNPMFRLGNAENVIDINGSDHPWEYDQVNIVCPVYKPGSDPRNMEQYIIYSVTKQEYDSCRITQPNPKIVALCNQPHELMYFTITFRSFTPTPGGLEFTPGHDYYFISTSSKNDLHRRVGGGCSSNNMKVVFRVAPVPPEAAAAGTVASDDVSLVNSNGLELEEGRSPALPPPRQTFSWSQGFRRAFSSSSSSSSPSYFYPLPQPPPRHERRPKNTAGYEDTADSVESAARHTNASSRPAFVPFVAMWTFLSLTLTRHWLLQELT